MTAAASTPPPGGKKKTLGALRLSTSERLELEEGRRRYPVTDHARPKTRAECADVPRPCPYVSCRYHLYLDVKEDGGLVLNRPDLEVDEMKESCALDVADRGGVILEDIGDIFGVCRERVRQVEAEAARHLRKRARLAGLEREWGDR